MLTAERFWERASRGDGCWEWLGKPGPRGYGQVKVDGRPQLAHRAAWFFTHGVWPEGDVRQLCGNRLCVRPDHLQAEGAPTPATRSTRRRCGSSTVVRGDKVRFRTSLKDPATGRRLQPSFTVPAAEAKHELNRIRSELADGRHQGTSATFGDLLDKALVIHVPNLSPTAQETFKNYGKYLAPLRD